MIQRMMWSGLASLMLVAGVQADVKPHVLFTDNMVLQQGREAPIWGTADPGEMVTVRLNIAANDAISLRPVEADKNGRWMAKFSNLPATAEGQAGATLEIEGKNKVILKNVLVGEVWIASGQSNMEWSVRASQDSTETVAAATDSRLRLYTVPKAVSMTPLDTIPSKPKWAECSPKTVIDFSAVAYYFGASLRKARKVLIGMIHTSWGGTQRRQEVLAEIDRKS